ncbi:MAG TPA: glycosyltransferase family 2 protein, partial [Edaphobacter sp.]|nr:glycosyltransferase family 2 protein [Edaphobacter sp.]
MDASNQNPDATSDLELSIILPARNEEQSLPACLASLVDQSEPGFALGLRWEIIIVNDDSTDRTREIAADAAANHPGITVLDAPPLDLSERGGFTGKNNACWAGAQIAR